MKVVSNLRNRITKFHNNEKGMETLQVVMIAAVAAIILALIVTQWPTIKQYATDAIKAITDFKE
jgi:hypothetical protein